MMADLDFEELLTRAEVSQAFQVHPETVTRWAEAGRLRSTRTLGGQRRYFKAEVEAFLRGSPQNGTAAEQRKVD
jgi:excisionase family DNA binding protein